MKDYVVWGYIETELGITNLGESNSAAEAWDMYTEAISQGCTNVRLVHYTDNKHIAEWILP